MNHDDDIGPDTGEVTWTTLNPDAYGNVLAYDTARTAINGWKDTQAKAKDQIIQIMGEATRAMFSGKHVVTKSVSRPRRFNQAAFRDDHPDLYERYCQPSEEPETRLWVPRRPLLPIAIRRPVEEP